jgi:hypothetical protein
MILSEELSENCEPEAGNAKITEGYRSNNNSWRFETNLAQFRENTPTLYCKMKRFLNILLILPVTVE